MENKGLRHYQQEAIQKVIPLIHQESRILISMPTGTGKSFTIINIVYEYYQRRGGVKEEKILFLVDRSVVADSIKRLALEKFDSVQVLKSITDAQPTISICNIRTPTLTNGFEKLPSTYYDIIVFFNCERFPFSSSNFINLLHHFDVSCKIGVTSVINDSISSYFGDVAYRYTLNAAITDGVLTSYKIVIPTDSFEFNEQELSVEYLSTLAKSILEFISNDKTIVFCKNIDYAKKISAEIIKITGQENYARAVVSNSESAVVYDTIKRFKNDDQLKVLTTVELLADGVVLPNVKYLIILKPIKSETIFLKLIPNFLGPYPAKEYLTVIDYTGSIHKVPERFFQYDKKNDVNEQPAVFVGAQAKILFRDNSLEGVIGVNDIAEELANLINIMPNESGRMIGIFGEWGRGKTFLMIYIWDNLEKKNSFYKVDFQAWKYQETPAVWAYLYEKIADSYYNSTTNIFRKLYRRFKLNFYRLGWYNVLFFLIYFCISLFVSFGISFDDKLKLFQVIYTSLGAATILSIITLVFRFKNSARELFNKYYSKASFTHVLGIQAEVQKELKNLIKAWVSFKGHNNCKYCRDRNRKILLFVDDIDRCSEDKIIKLIDSLRIMLDDEELSRKLIIVTAIDDRILKRAIKLKYIHFTKTGVENLSIDNLVCEYMDKLFIIGIKLGSLTSDEKDEFFLELTKKDRDSFVPTSFSNLFQEKEPDEHNNYNYAQETAMANDNESSAEHALDVNSEDGEIYQDGGVGTENSPNVDIESNLKLTSYEIDVLRRKLQLYPKANPRQIRIFYYRYLIAKQLLIKQYDKIREENIWLQSQYIELFIELLIKLSQCDDYLSVSKLKASIIESNDEDFLLEGIIVGKSVDKVHCKRLVCVLDTVIGY